MAYQWMVNFTTSSSSVPPRPPISTITTMLGTLFTSPSNVWLAGPQSVDDSDLAQSDGPPTTVYQWVISLQTTNTTAPSVAAIQAALAGVFGTSVSNVWLAGPQSVDDGPAEASR